MNSINRLLDFLTKEEEDLPFENFATSSTATSTVSTPKPMEVGTGGQAASAASVQTSTPGKADGEDPTAPHGHDRLYLSEIGGKAPETYKGKVFSGRQGAQFIDRRKLTPAQKDDINPKDENKETSYGGIIINDQGQILLRKPKDHYGGHHWTFAKGGADEGEAPHTAAIREVEEETGLKCEIVGDIPGHFQGTLGNNKFFLMRAVGGDKSLFQTNETSDVQWFDPADAEAQIGKTGEENPKGMKRDLDVLKAAFHEHGDQKNSELKVSQMIQHVQENPTPANFKIMEGVEDVAKHFATTGELPSYYTDSAHLNYDAYQPFREAVLDRLINPSNTSGSINEWISTIYNDKAFQDKYGIFSPSSDSAHAVGLSAMAALRKTLLYEHIERDTPSWSTPLAISEYLGEVLNAPQVYATKGHGQDKHIIPPDIDIHGNKMYRSLTEREALSKAWETWKAGGEAVGKLPSKYNPATGKMQGGDTFDFSVGGWEIAGERASETHKVRQDSGVDANIKKTLTTFGKNIPKLPGEKTQAQAGERLIRDFVQFHRKLNTQMLDMAYPNVNHMVLYRSIGGANEVAPGTGVGAGKPLSPDDLHKFGMPQLGEETIDNTYESYVNSRPGAGWGLHPLSGFGRDYTLAAEVPKSNVFLSSLDMQNMAGEREWMVLNNPNMRVKVMHHVHYPSSLLKKSQDWDYMPNLNGIAIKGMFHEKKGIGATAIDSDGKPHTWHVGVDEPDKDWSTLGTLGPKQGSRPGGMFTDPDGQKWYIKHGHEDQHVVEDLANKVYRHAGIKVPETKLINWKGKVAYASRILDDVDETKSYTGESLKNKPDIHDGFLVDALLGNWDVAGTGYSNILPNTNGEHYRIDNGGSLYLRAQGDEKVFGPTDDMKAPVTELSTLLDSDMNKESATVFGGMTQKAMQSSFEKLSKLNNTSIANMVHASGIPPYRMDDMVKALVSRRNNIVQWLVDNNHLTGLPEVGDAASQYRAIENKYNLRKAETITEDNPTIDIALEILKKRPLLSIAPTGGYTQREDMDDTERN